MHSKLNVRAFAFAWGLSFGLYFLILGWTAMFGWGNQIVEVASSLYIGYAPTFWGGIIGGIWAFADWTLGAAIVALIYNAAVKE
ncbi:MAG: bacteriophage holin [Patescibacteria group bacterium]|nr:bacteriophage holin [Patescibacteria group bacterium]